MRSFCGIPVHRIAIRLENIRHLLPGKGNGENRSVVRAAVKYIGYLEGEQQQPVSTHAAQAQLQLMGLGTEAVARAELLRCQLDRCQQQEIHR